MLAAMLAIQKGEERCRRFWSCGTDIWVYQHAVSKEMAYRHNHCGDRFCLVCGRLRSALIADSLAQRVEKMSPLFITLTISGKPGDELRPLLDKLKAAWRSLKETAIFRSKISGGAAMLEVKWSVSAGGHWHPHLHILADGKYLEQGWLSNIWRALSGGSSIVYITRVNDAGKVLRYVSKYASKPMDGSFLRKPHHLQEAMLALRGQRLCSCFGSWYGTPLMEEIPDEEEPVFTQWRCLGSERAIRGRASNGEREAAVLLAAMERFYRLQARQFDGMRSAPTLCHPPDS